MKNILKVFVTVSLLATSCSLDYEPTTQYSATSFWYSAKNVQSGLTGCYTPLIHGYMFGAGAVAFEECVTPNAYNYYNNNGWNDIAKGTHTKDVDIANGRWTQCFTGIGRCNNLIENIDKVKDMQQTEIETVKAEARFLRALYYFILSEYYYSAPLITDTPDMSQIDEPRAEREDLIDFIVKELDKAANVLPKTASSAGHATKGAALALKARVLLFEASPLCNPDADAEPYIEAANAAKAVMDLKIYSLYPNYKTLFKESNENSCESIFALQCISNPVNSGHSLDMIHAKDDSAEPVQELFEGMVMKDGKARKDSKYSKSTGFDNVDPRFASCVAYPGSQWMGRELTMSSNGYWTNIQTGYLYKKYTVYSESTPTSEQLALRNKSQCSPTDIMILRYADVLLMYAEAINESGQMNSQIWAMTVGEIRNRAGFDIDALAWPGDVEKSREIINYERRAEFLGEGTWYNDLRRNKLAASVCAVPVHRYDGVELYSRTFNPERDYWWPVPAKQIELAPSLEPNNPNW